MCGLRGKARGLSAAGHPNEAPMVRTNITPLLTLTLLPLAMAACAGPPDAPETERAPLETTSEALGKNALTNAEAKTALKLIDDICGDTWCSGDYDFHFDSLKCNAASASCTLGLELLPREGVPSTKNAYFRSCRTSAFSGFDSLVVTAANGYQSLDQDYYFALTDCISALEAELAAAPGPCPVTAASATPRREN
jgi:hypothetical protein